MSGELRVNADELRVTADQLDMYAADLRHGHSAAYATTASAVSGFGATMSAAALNERIAQWELETTDHHAELGHLGYGHRVACACYTTTDADSSERITTAGGAGDEAAGAIDL